MTDGFLCAAFSMMFLGPTLLGLCFNLDRSQRRAGSSDSSDRITEWVLHPPTRNPLSES